MDKLTPEDYALFSVARVEQIKTQARMEMLLQVLTQRYGLRDGDNLELDGSITRLESLLREAGSRDSASESVQ